jgi:hypothetical protein
MMYTVTVTRPQRFKPPDVLHSVEGTSLTELIDKALKWREKHAPDATIEYHLQPGI